MIIKRRRAHETELAIAYALRTGCSAAEAAKRHGIGVRAVQRGLAAAGAARPVGHPIKPAEI